MIQSKYIVNPYLMEDEEDEKPKDEKQPEQVGPMMMKKMEKMFFEKRAIYFWGVVEDKTVRDAVSKLLLLDADKPGEEIKLYINIF